MENRRPTPRGFSPVDIDLDDPKVTSVTFLSCESCGAMTVFPEKHKTWHKKNDR